jgi:hypothetical protein
VSTSSKIVTLGIGWELTYIATLTLGTHGDIFSEEEARCCNEYRSLDENASIIRVLRE